MAMMRPLFFKIPTSRRGGLFMFGNAPPYRLVNWEWTIVINELDEVATWSLRNLVLGADLMIWARAGSGLRSKLTTLSCNN